MLRVHNGAKRPRGFFIDWVHPCSQEHGIKARRMWLSPARQVAQVRTLPFARVRVAHEALVLVGTEPLLGATRRVGARARRPSRVLALAADATVNPQRRELPAQHDLRKAARVRLSVASP
eukprot:6194427-Pleurochrysis_carterae.AAC.5